MTQKAAHVVATYMHPLTPCYKVQQRLLVHPLTTASVGMIWVFMRSVCRAR